MVRQRPKTKAKKKPSSRLTKPAIALGIPAVLLTVAVVLAYIPRGLDVYDLPSQIPFREQLWMTYVPTDASLVKFYNFSRIISSPGSQYAIQNGTLIYVYDTKYTVDVTEATYTFEVMFGENLGVDVFALRPEAYQAFLANASATLPTQNAGGYTFFLYRANATAFERVHAVFKDGLVFEAAGGSSAFQLVEKVLKNHDDNLTSFFSTPERHSEFYVVTNTEARMMGFSVLTNATLAGSHEWVTAVYDANTTIDLVKFYAYSTQKNATQMYSTAETQILTPNFARSYIIGNFIAETRSFPWNQARTPMNSL